MLTVRKGTERPHTRIAWLDSRHTFSFGEHYDPRQMGFRSLRVINEDRVRPASGFGTHAHRDMEILSWVLEGSLEHKDSMGTGSVIRPGEIQRMSAGTGVRHSEWNPSKTDEVHFLQIWLLPAEQGIPPGYEQKRFEDAELSGGLRVIASPDGRDGSVRIHQDARLYAARLAGGGSVTHDLAPGRGAWIHVARGDATVNGTLLHAGDGAAVEDTTRLEITAGPTATEILLFDLA